MDGGLGVGGRLGSRLPHLVDVLGARKCVTHAQNNCPWFQIDVEKMLLRLFTILLLNGTLLLIPAMSPLLKSFAASPLLKNPSLARKKKESIIQSLS